MPLEERNLRLFDCINNALADAGLDKIEWANGRGGSDAAYTTIYGIPSIDSLGTAGGYIHAKEEYCYISSFMDCARRLCAIAIGL